MGICCRSKSLDNKNKWEEKQNPNVLEKISVRHRFQLYSESNEKYFFKEWLVSFCYLSSYHSQLFLCLCILLKAGPPDTKTIHYNRSVYRIVSILGFRTHQRHFCMRIETKNPRAEMMSLLFWYLEVFLH